MTRVTGSLDTNVLLRLLLNDVPEQHAAAVRLFNGVDGRLAVADLAIVEVVFVLQRAYGYTRIAVADVLGSLLTMHQLNCNRALFEQVLPLYVHSPALSFEDCCLTVYANLSNAGPLWTFDKKLAKQAPAARLVA